MEYYYLDKAGQPAGPTAEALLRALRNARAIDDKTLVTEVGGTEWRTYASVFGRTASPSASPSPSSQSKTFVMIGAAVVAAFLLAGGGVWAIFSGGLLPIRGGETSLDSDFNVPASQRLADPEVHPTTPPEAPTQTVLGGLDPAVAEASAAKKPEEPAVEDPLGEWYEFGFNIGREAARSYVLMDVEAEPSEAQLAQVMQNLGVGADAVPLQAMRIAFSGFRDGFDDSPVKLKPPQTQTESRLPPELQLYTALKTTQVAAPKTNNSHIEHTQACTLRIDVVGRDQSEGLGSGFFVAPGLVATNRHVVQGAISIRLLDHQGRFHEGTVAEESSHYDLALVRIEYERHPILRLRSTASVKVGDEIAVVGFPRFRLESPTANFGRISNTDRDCKGHPCIQLDMTINHGNSGGPVTDFNGEVIGIASFGLAEMDVDRFNFAIKSDLLMVMLRDHLR